MTTDHINRWNLLSDDEFLKNIVLYRRFKHMPPIEHSINIDYIIKRCANIGYEFSVGCCGRNYLTQKNDIQK